MSTLFTDTYPITETALRWLENIISERFGNKWSLKRDIQGLHLKLIGTENEIIFDKINNDFTKTNLDIPCSWWNCEEQNWNSVLKRPMPVVGESDIVLPLIEFKNQNCIIHYDIPGLIYWMLTRLEEIGCKDLDVHERFSSASSHAYKHNYLDRPIVDEWLHLLGQVIKIQWPKIILKQHTGNTIVSCDVDSPFTFDGSWNKLIRRLGGDLIKRRSFKSVMETLLGSCYASLGNYKFDSDRKGIDYIMDVNENLGRSVAFYFIPELTDPTYDGKPRLQDPRMVKIFQEIHHRGHEIGIHPGYNTYSNSLNMERSVKTFRRALENAGIKQERIGGRQHFLRWQTPTTACLWEVNGLDYDTTLSYADRPGFRCGSCFEYPMFDPVKQKILRLRQRPLIIMESSVIADHYLGLGYSDQALNLMRKYRDTCHDFGGNFCILWHNSHFKNEKDKQFYQDIVK